MFIKIVSAPQDVDISLEIICQLGKAAARYGGKGDLVSVVDGNDDDIEKLKAAGIVAKRIAE